jgi:hypothetical protein
MLLMLTVGSSFAKGLPRHEQALCRSAALRPGVAHALGVRSACQRISSMNERSHCAQRANAQIERAKVLPE